MGATAPSSLGKAAGSSVRLLLGAGTGSTEGCGGAKVFFSIGLGTGSTEGLGARAEVSVAVGATRGGAIFFSSTLGTGSTEGLGAVVGSAAGLSTGLGLTALASGGTAAPAY